MPRHPKPVEPNSIFSRLTATGEWELREVSSGKNITFCECTCACDGKVVWVAASRLREGTVKSCGCMRSVAQSIRHEQSGKKCKVCSGQQFGNLTVLGPAVKPGITAAECKCACGEIVICGARDLLNGHRTSCGKPECRTRTRSPFDAAMRRRFVSCRASARSRGLSFEITFQEFLELINMECHYCGEPGGNRTNIRRSTGTEEVRCNGVDRKDSRYGYTLSNVVPCCGTCNTCKMDLSYEAFIERCHRIAGRHPVQGGIYENSAAA